MNIIGLSAFYHDSACCLIQNGEIVAAAAEERFSRRKHDPANRCFSLIVSIGGRPCGSRFGRFRFRQLPYFSIAIQPNVLVTHKRNRAIIRQNGGC